MLKNLVILISKLCQTISGASRAQAQPLILFSNEKERENSSGNITGIAFCRFAFDIFQTSQELRFKWKTHVWCA